MSEIVESALGRFRRVTDGEKKWWLWECPICKRWGGFSEAQWEGKVSVDHSKMHTDCTYHEKHEFGRQLIAAMRANIVMGGPVAVEDDPLPPPPERPMYGMTREEAAEKAMLYDKLLASLYKMKAYLESTMHPGNVKDILRPVAWALDDDDPPERP